MHSCNFKYGRLFRNGAGLLSWIVPIFFFGLSSSSLAHISGLGEVQRYVLTGEEFFLLDVKEKAKYIEALRKWSMKTENQTWRKFGARVDQSERSFFETWILAQAVAQGGSGGSVSNQCVIAGRVSEFVNGFCSAVVAKARFTEQFGFLGDAFHGDCGDNQIACNPILVLEKKDGGVRPLCASLNRDGNPNLTKNQCLLDRQDVHQATPTEIAEFLEGVLRDGGVGETNVACSFERIVDEVAQKGISTNNESIEDDIMKKLRDLQSQCPFTKIRSYLDQVNNFCSSSVDMATCSSLAEIRSKIMEKTETNISKKLKTKVLEKIDSVNKENYARKRAICMVKIANKDTLSVPLECGVYPGGNARLIPQWSQSKGANLVRSNPKSDSPIWNIFVKLNEGELIYEYRVTINNDCTCSAEALNAPTVEPKYDCDPSKWAKVCGGVDRGLSCGEGSVKNAYSDVYIQPPGPCADSKNDDWKKIENGVTRSFKLGDGGGDDAIAIFNKYASESKGKFDFEPVNFAQFKKSIEDVLFLTEIRENGSQLHQLKDLLNKGSIDEVSDVVCAQTTKGTSNSKNQNRLMKVKGKELYVCGRNEKKGLPFFRKEVGVFSGPFIAFGKEKNVPYVDLNLSKDNVGMNSGHIPLNLKRYRNRDIEPVFEVGAAPGTGKVEIDCTKKKGTNRVTVGTQKVKDLPTSWVARTRKCAHKADDDYSSDDLFNENQVMRMHTVDMNKPAYMICHKKRDDNSWKPLARFDVSEETKGVEGMTDRLTGQLTQLGDDGRVVDEETISPGHRVIKTGSPLGVQYKVGRPCLYVADQRSVHSPAGRVEPSNTQGGVPAIK